MCGSLTELFGPTMEKRPAGAECGPCCVQIHKARRKAMREAQQQATGGRRRVKITDPEAVDRYDRARLRGSSVSTVSAGLPGLGKRS